MKEMLRIVHGRLDEGTDGRLTDYNLEVFAGDIMYVQGMEGSGIRTLVRVLAGDAKLSEGELLLSGGAADDYTRNRAQQYKVYTITSEQELVESLTVTENLEAIRRVGVPLRIFHKRSAQKRVAEYLRDAGIEVSADDEIWKLSQRDRRKLSILKARLHGAELVILDATHGRFAGQDAGELCELICKANAEGVTFIILTRHYEMFAEIATRLQLMADGMDIKEWGSLTHRVRSCLQNPAAAPLRDSDREKMAFIGLYDREWETEAGIWQYLRTLQQQNPELWEEVIRAEVPDEGTGFAEGIVLIPAGGRDQFVPEITLADNLVLAIPERAGRFGYLAPNVQAAIAARFYRETGISPDKQYAGDLDRLERKLFMLYRASLKKPGIIILESPYTGLNTLQTQQLRSYMLSLQEKGIRIFYFSRNAEDFREDCCQVILSENGRRAKIST